MTNPAKKSDDLMALYDSAHEVAARMAETIIEITQKDGGCLPQDLNAHDFTPEEVVEHYHLAKSLAEAELKLMNFKEPIKPKSLLRK